MTHEEAVDILGKKGYQAMVIDGVVKICTSDHDDFDKMRRILTRAKYNGSYGWLKKQEGKNDVG